MNIFDRIDRLQLLLEEAGGEIWSKKKLHKLVYLLQQAGENFAQDFKYHNFGVFSPTLANDLEFAESTAKIIIEKPQGGAWGYTVRLGEEALRQDRVPISDKARHLIMCLVEREPQFLETLSTIVYLNRNYYHGKALRQKLGELKPDLSQRYDEAFNLAKELFQIDIES